MLQQTQVVTVLGYYQRFLNRFPDVASLADAAEDDVLACWSGLGYYSRARNLHKAAQQVMELHGGAFPTTAVQLAELPGIGRSTASAISSFCFDERVPILDANVRRVLTRYLAFDADLARPVNERALWQRAEQLVPEVGHDMPAYTQGLMDLGATVCLPVRPSCLLCPLAKDCGALALGRPEQFPVRTRTIQRKTEQWWLLLLRDTVGRIWLEKRPAPGIWAGLHCLPVFADYPELQAAAAGAGDFEPLDLPVVHHVLTHRDLVLHPALALVTQTSFASDINGQWVGLEQLPDVGVPAPIRILLNSLA